MSKRALITGITGMDGSHLADLLLEHGYEVHGLVRRCSRPVTERLTHIVDRIHLHEGDVLDAASLNKTLWTVMPDEIYNLAAQSFVGTSWAQPELTAQVTGLGTLRVLEAVRREGLEDCRFYQASSSEMFGNQPGPQNEETPFRPRSPYGAAKVFAHNLAVNYRESYGMHISCGILFNHESERRGLEFVTRKIARQVAEIVVGSRDKLELGNLDARRDWGYAPDYVEAMRRMLQLPEPQDLVIATGRTWSVGDFARAALAAADLHDVPIHSDPQLLRPAELHELRGDFAKARDMMRWSHTVGFHGLVRRMVEHELGEVKAWSPSVS